MESSLDRIGWRSLLWEEVIRPFGTAGAALIVIHHYTLDTQKRFATFPLL